MTSQRLNGTIYLAPYDPVWESRFSLLAHRIREALGTKVRLLEHVGSTSVPGLAAKPVIDIVLAVARAGFSYGSAIDCTLAQPQNPKP